MRNQRNTWMTKAMVAGGALAIVLVVLLVLVDARRSLRQSSVQKEEPAALTSPLTTVATAEAAEEAHQGFIFGHVTTVDGTPSEGRLRFGDDEEAFWGDYFN